MSMQVHVPFVIKLIFRNTAETARIYSFIDETVGVEAMSVHLACHKFGSPTGFQLIQLNVPYNSSKFINWLQHDFKPMFDYDPLLWLASVATLPAEFRQYLIPFHKDTYDNAIS